MSAARHTLPAGRPAVGPGPLQANGGAGTVLELDEVTKTYPGLPPVRALAAVSFAVAAGELIAVVGPSGSGKSTLLHLMGTLDRPSTGTVRVTGLDVAALGDRQLSALRATSIGFVFEHFFLTEHATVLDNVAGGLRPVELLRRPPPRPGSRAPRSHLTDTATQTLRSPARARSSPTMLSCTRG